MIFPLFEIILSDIKDDDDINEKEENYLCEKIKKLDNEGHEMIYALIKCYAIKFENNYDSPPYDPKKTGKGFKYCIEKIPRKLLKILLNFVKKHDDKLKEENALRV